MAVSAGTVFLPVVADTKGLGASIAAGVKSASGEVKGALGGVASNIGIALGVGAAAVLSKTTQAFVDLGGQVKSLQRTTGLAAESASKLLFVGHSLGIEATSMNTAFGLLAKNIANNATNFTKYGIATQDAKGQTLGLDTILGEAADKYVALGGGLAGAAFAMNVFGRSGKTLIPILALGSKGLKDMEAQAASFGVVLSQQDVDASRQLAVAQRELGTAFEGLAVSVGREVVPAMTTLAHAMTDVVKFMTAIPGPIKAGVLAFTALTGGIIAVAKVAKILSLVWGPIGSAIATATVAAYGYITALISLASTEGIAATASFALEGALAALSGPLFPIIAAAALLGAGVLALATDFAKLGDALAAGVQPAINIGAAFVLARKAAIPYGAALDILNAQSGATAVSLEDLQKASEAFDPTALISGSQDAVVALTDLGLNGAGALKDFAKVSGQSIDTIESDLAKLIQDPKATLADLTKAIEDTKSAWADWHQSIADAFGGASSALDQFAGKSNVDFGKMVGSLQSYMDKLRQWRTDFQTLSHDKSSAEFLKAASQGGMEWLGILDSVANQAPKSRAKFFDLFNSANKGTDSLASLIQHKLVPAFDNMLTVLEAIANKLGANYKLKVDTKPAVDAVNRFLTFVGNSTAVIPLTVVPVGGGPKGPQGHEHGGFFPGAASGGFVRSPNIIQVGEKSKAEMILPLTDASGITALAKALAKAGARNGSGRLHIIGGKVDLDTGQLRLIAREEQDDDAEFRRTIGMMA